MLKKQFLISSHPHLFNIFLLFFLFLLAPLIIHKFCVWKNSYGRFVYNFFPSLHFIDYFALARRAVWERKLEWEWEGSFHAEFINLIVRRGEKVRRRRKRSRGIWGNWIFLREWKLILIILREIWGFLN